MTVCTRIALQTRSGGSCTKDAPTHVLSCTRVFYLLR